MQSNMKGVTKGYPLRIEPDKVEVKETEFNAGEGRGYPWISAPLG
jgi:hypothetical protein